MRNQIVILLAVLVVTTTLGRRLFDPHEVASGSGERRAASSQNSSNGSHSVPRETRAAQHKSVRFSTRKKTGYSIHGIQPGDDLQQLLDELPPQSKVGQIKETHPRPGLSFTAPGQQEIAVSSVSVGDRKIVSEVWCMGPGSNFSIEHNGKPVLWGDSFHQEFTKLLGAEVHQRGVVTPDGRRLRVEFTSNGLFVASLSRFQ